MTHPAIRVSNLSKRYQIGVARNGGTNFREALVELVKSPFRRFQSLSGRGSAQEDFWALKDVSFEVQQGDVVGIIGHNGAGKSTLLKVLAQIVEPTTGRIEISGRVASLLEVGTGFHPDLTGRENIYLNGAILGMKRTEIRAKFDQIVDFAEVEKFLDTPVKRYSSGMYMRLAFAVAAHLDPEILIVDEVLAVGDASFQKKCMGRIGEVAQGGRTVLFVSHSLQSVTRLCTRGILMAEGKVVACGGIDEIVRVYMSSNEHGPSQQEWSEAKAPGSPVARLRSARVRDAAGNTVQNVDIRRPVAIEMEYEVLTPGHVLAPNVHVFNSDGVCVFIALGWENNSQPQAVGRIRSTVWIPGNQLAEGTLSVAVALSTLDPVVVHYYVPSAVAFEVVDSFTGDSARGPYGGSFGGMVRPMLKWDHEPISHEGRIAGRLVA